MSCGIAIQSYYPFCFQCVRVCVCVHAYVFVRGCGLVLYDQREYIIHCGPGALCNIAMIQGESKSERESEKEREREEELLKNQDRTEAE